MFFRKSKRKGLVSKKRIKYAFRKLRKDQRFFLFICILKPHLLATPILALLGIFSLYDKMDETFLGKTNFWVSSLAAVVYSINEVFKLITLHAHFLKWKDIQFNKAARQSQTLT